MDGGGHRGPPGADRPGDRGGQGAEHRACAGARAVAPSRRPAREPALGDEGFGIERPAKAADSDDLDLAADAALGVDHLAAVAGLHAGAKAELAGALHLADSLGVMHVF